MKIYLLDNDSSMINEWKKLFKESEELEIINDDFEHFMNTHEDIDGIVAPSNSFGIMHNVHYNKDIIDYLGERAQTNVYTILNIIYNQYQPIGTTIGVSFYKYIILHTPVVRTPEEIIDQRVVFDCMLSCLRYAKSVELKSIVIPAFGTTIGNVPKDVVAELMHFAYEMFINDTGDDFIDNKWKSTTYISNTLRNIIIRKCYLNTLSMSNYITGSLSTDSVSIKNTVDVNNLDTNNLKSLDEYIKDNAHIQKQVSGMLQDYSEPKYKCPKCGGNVRQNLTMVLTSCPPKYRYECDKCDHVDFHEF